MPQRLFYLLTALLTLLAQLFSLNVLPVPEKGELPMEDMPQLSERQVFDRVDGVDDSVFYIARPKAAGLNAVNAANFGLDTASADNF